MFLGKRFFSSKKAISLFLHTFFLSPFIFRSAGEQLHFFFAVSEKKNGKWERKSLQVLSLCVQLFFRERIGGGERKMSLVSKREQL